MKYTSDICADATEDNTSIVTAEAPGEVNYFFLKVKQPHML